MTSDIVIGEDRLEMTRYFDYPRQAVFDAWTKPEQLEQWWGCKDTEKVSSTIDLRVGGEFRHTMQIKTAGECHYSGRYTEIIVPEKIVCECAMNAHPDSAAASTVTVEFLEEGDGTRMKLTQVGLPEMPGMDMGEIISTGFSAAFKKLERHLAG